MAAIKKFHEARLGRVAAGVVAAMLGGWPLAAASQAADETGAATAGEPNGTAPDGESSFLDRFKDPSDGRFDVTASGSGGSGLIPLVIPFNDPAVGAGVVAGIVYFHPDHDDDEASAPSNAPPTTSFAGAAKSDNDSWVVAGGHSRGFKDDRIRYLGGIGKASVNLDFYGIADSALNENPISFNLEGGMLLQQLQFQLGESRAAAGFRFTYLDTTTTFDILPDDVEGLGAAKDAGLGVFVKWDTRDTTFTPSSGVSLVGRLSQFSESLGGDFSYTKFTLTSRTYWPLREGRLVLGLRADYAHVGGDAPFYSLSWISLRGVPAFRYLGNDAVTMEVEPRWKVDERWSVLGFAGFGRAAKDASGLTEADGAYNYGTGFRYLLSRRLGLAAGIDLARGPEDSIVVLTFGSAWGL